MFEKYHDNKILYHWKFTQNSLSISQQMVRKERRCGHTKAKWKIQHTTGWNDIHDIKSEATFKYMIYVKQTLQQSEQHSNRISSIPSTSLGMLHEYIMEFISLGPIHALTLSFSRTNLFGLPAMGQGYAVPIAKQGKTFPTQKYFRNGSTDFLLSKSTSPL